MRQGRWALCGRVQLRVRVKNFRPDNKTIETIPIKLPDRTSRVCGKEGGTLWRSLFTPRACEESNTVLYSTLFH